MLAVVVFLVLLVRAAHSGSGSCAKNVLWETEISQQFNKVSEMENGKCLPQMVRQLMLLCYDPVKKNQNQLMIESHPTLKLANKLAVY